MTRLLSLRFPLELVCCLFELLRFPFKLVDFLRLFVVQGGLSFGSLSHFRLETIVILDMFLINLVDGGADHLAWSILSRADTLDQAWKTVMGGVLGAGGPGEALLASQRNCLAIGLDVGYVFGSTLEGSADPALEYTRLGL